MHKHTHHVELKTRYLIVHIFCTSSPSMRSFQSIRFFMFRFFFSFSVALDFPSNGVVHCTYSPPHLYPFHSIPFLINNRNQYRRSIHSLNTCSSFCESHAYYIKFIPITQKTVCLHWPSRSCVVYSARNIRDPFTAYPVSTRLKPRPHFIVLVQNIIQRRRERGRIKHNNPKNAAERRT